MVLSEKRFTSISEFNTRKRRIIMQTETLKVTGMTCDGRTKGVARALKALAESPWCRGVALDRRG